MNICFVEYLYASQVAHGGASMTLECSDGKSITLKFPSPLVGEKFSLIADALSPLSK
jgi:hypothetical protein